MKGFEILMKKFKSLLIILIIFLFILTGCEFEEIEEDTLESKITSEIEYIEGKLISIINKLVLEEYKDNEWEEDTRKIEEASNRILVDLASKSIDNSEITKFSDGVNNMILAVSNEDVKAYLVELNNVFSLFPNYEAKISNESDEIFERRLKYFTISTFIAFYVGDTELAKAQVDSLESEYLEKQRSVEYVEEHKYNMNKIYLLIEELKRGIEANSLDLVREKYLMLIDEI